MSTKPILYSRFLSLRQLKTLERLCNIINNAATPMQDADIPLAALPVADLNDLKLLLTLLSLEPKFSLVFFLKVTESLAKISGKLGAPFRLVEIGLKGLAFSLYYGSSQSGKILESIGYDAKVKNPMEHTMAKHSNNNYSEIRTKARNASSAIAELNINMRITLIKNVRNYVLAHQERLIDSLILETKKSRTDALTSEIFPILDHLLYLENHGKKILHPETVMTPIALLGKKSKIYFEPCGTVLIICPWNYPLFQALVPILNAFLAGNSVIYKPSELTPLTGILEEIFRATGFNANWIQIVYGDGKTGSELIETRPEKIFFIGSVATGKKIMTAAANHLIPVELELGGKDPMIVFEDANLSRAVKAAAWGAFTNSGQSCTSIERLYIQDSIFQKFTDLLIQETKQLRIFSHEDFSDTQGDYDMGAMTSKSQVEKISKMVTDAKAKGAKFLTGGEWDGKSAVIPPMLITNVTDDMLLMSEEIFGPLLPIIPFKNEEEAIQLANDSEYGLAAAVFTNNKSRAESITRKLQTGNVSVNNVMISEGNPALPFGGVKNSGIGRYKGAMGLRSFTQPKSVLFDSDSGKIEANWYPYTAKKYLLFTKLIQGLFQRTLFWLINFAVAGLKLELYSQKAKRNK